MNYRELSNFFLYNIQSSSKTRFIQIFLPRIASNDNPILPFPQNHPVQHAYKSEEWG